MQYRHAISSDLEKQLQERTFEAEFGREMTLEEKRLYSLSGEFLQEISPKEEPGARSSSNLRVMPPQIFRAPGRKTA